jgi:hypothetical protein
MSSINTTADCNGVPAAVTDDILSSRRRCLLVTALAAAGGDAVVEDLAAAIFAAEEGGPPETDPQACDDVARELYENRACAGQTRTARTVGVALVRVTARPHPWRRLFRPLYTY